MPSPLKPARPDFFIVGAPKCGTTALYQQLAGHSRIFMSDPKEPHFFAGDLPGWSRGLPYRESLEDYLDLFRGAGPQHRAIGEASVWYLFSSAAAPAIREFDPGARLIAMLRNPVDMAHALHAQLVVNLREDCVDFRAAWERQAARREGRLIPRHCDEPRVLQYREVCSLGEQCRRLLRVFPRDQVLFLLFDDLEADGRAVYERTLAFLGVESDGRSEFPRVNESQVLRSRWLALLARRGLRFEPWVRLKRRLGLPVRSHLRIPPSVYRKSAPRPALDPALRAELTETFRDDVLSLQELLQRDLGHWLRPGPS